VYTVAFTLGEENHRLQIGKQNPAGTGYYTLLDDNSDVYLIANVTYTDSFTNLVDTLPFEPEPTPTPEPVLNLPGQIFTGLVATDVDSFSITDNATGNELLATRNEESGELAITSATIDPAGRETDTNMLSIVLSEYAALNSRVQGVTGADLAALGLTDPVYTLLATSGEQTYRLQVGVQDATGTLYYTLIDDFDQVALLPASSINFLVSLIDNPPYLPLPEVTPEIDAETTPDVDASAAPVESTAAVTEAATAEITETPDD